ncbi:thermonuclease family protein [Planctellipticum variicoloris]|uniref:thermonuclease family protein n=1 Tax=Planctellipticum variicoloris TaxID=3064265 RepID=UPI0030140B8E|nr:thermonuclease family protein [Planctomycetaceae bacterium SH412]
MVDAGFLRVTRTAISAWLVISLFAGCDQFDLASALSSRPPTEPRIVETLTGKVIRIADGDTLTILTDDNLQVKIRLEGIDAPERGQAYGMRATTALAEMVSGRVVNVHTTGTDKYDRTLGFVEVDGTDVNLKLVEDGWGWHFTKYNSQEKFATAERAARAAKRGLWAQDRPMAPWDYRGLEKPVIVPAGFVGPRITAAEKPEIVPASSTRKFWLNTGTGVRHNSRCRNFANTNHGYFCRSTEGRACGICGG